MQNNTVLFNATPTTTFILDQACLLLKHGWFSFLILHRFFSLLVAHTITVYDELKVVEQLLL
jgi:hypothetical protein